MLVWSDLIGSLSAWWSSGSQVTFESAATTRLSVCEIDIDKAIVAYADGGNSSYGTACVLTVSGSTITAGTPVVFESASVASGTLTVQICKIGTDKALVAYCDGGNSSRGTACVLTVSGSTITAGTPVVFETGITVYISLTSLGADKAIVSYQDNSNSSRGTACVLTVSGSTITVGTPVAYETAQTEDNHVCTIDTDKALVAYRDNYADTFAKVLTVSGTTITSNTRVSVESSSGQTRPVALAALDTNRACVWYFDTAGGGLGTPTAKVLSVSGTTVSVGAANALPSAVFAAACQLDIDKAFYATSISGSSNYGYPTSVSGDSVTTGSAVLFESTVLGTYPSVCKIADNKVVVVWRDPDDTYGKAVVIYK